MSNLIQFDFESKPIRTVDDGTGNPWFVAADVCAALGLENVTRALERLDDDEMQVIDFATLNTSKGVINQGLNPRQQINIINESGLYSLTLTSRKPEAKRFKKWVTSKVLPSIRKTGSYTLPKSSKDTSALDARRRALALKDAMSSADKLVAMFPDLSGISQQEVYSRLINSVMGAPLLPQPEIEKVYSATEVGNMFSPPIHRNTIGRKANELNIKTPEFGKYVLGAAENVDKQVAQFLYNDKGVEKLKLAFRSEEITAESFH